MWCNHIIVERASDLHSETLACVLESACSWWLVLMILLAGSRLWQSLTLILVGAL